MFVIHGTDYTLYIFVGVTVLILFSLQYVLCCRARKLMVKFLPFLSVLLCLAMALLSMCSGNNGSFIDLRALVALLFLIYGLVCAASIGLAWLVYRLRKRQKK